MFQSTLNLLPSVIFISSALCLSSRADEAYLTPKEGGQDYALQGEFVGIVEPWGGAYAAQVVSLGDDEFDVFLLPGGLPGDGFRKEIGTKSVRARIDGEWARGRSDAFSVKLEKASLSIYDASDKMLAELIKVQRQSPTLGAKAPKDAIVLFDGSNADAFKDGKLTDEKTLSVGCETKEHFLDHQLHIEFRTPFMPLSRGQKRGNSGVYLQGYYEVQVLDSFGLEGKDNECGGIYKVSEPKFNMCFPPLTWQTYDIDFVAARYNDLGSKVTNAHVTVRHNGVVIHQDLELPTHTQGKNKEANAAGPLFLQNHKNPVVFRNIWVVKK